MADQAKQRMTKAAKVFALTAAVGGAELVLDGGSAEASVVTGSFGQLNRTNTITVTITGIPGGGSVKAGLLPSKPFSWYGSSLQAAQTTAGTHKDMVLFQPGDTVGASQIIGNSVELPDNFDGYIGFRFDGTTSNTYHYGYVRAVGNGDGTELSLTKYAYEDEADKAITIVPEPSSLFLLALGAGGLGLYRSRRKKQQAEEDSVVV